MKQMFRMRCEDALAQQRLIERAQAGDSGALEALLAAHRPFLCMISSRLEAPFICRDELVQAGYLGMLQALSHYDVMRGCGFMTYAVPWILGEMKKAIRKSRSAPAAVSMQAEFGDDGVTLEETISGRENIDFSGIELRMALEKLTGEERLLICLRYFRDKTQKETADLLKKSQAQISRAERRALDKLQAMMSG